MISKIIYFFSFSFFAYILYENWSVLESLGSDLISFRYQFLILAIFLQFWKYYLLAYSFYLNFKQAGVDFKFKDILKATFVYLYFSVSAPLVGAGGFLAFFNHASEKNVSRAKVGAGALLALITDYIAFIFLVLISVLIFKDALEDFPSVYISGIVFLGISLITFIVVAIYVKKWLIFGVEIFRKFANFLGRLFYHKPLYDDAWAHRNVQIAHECFVDIKKSPQFYLYSTFICFLSHVLNILTLAVIGWALKESLPLSKLTSTYIIVNTLESISPTPNGIGVVESLTPKYMTSLGINFSNSLVIVSIFRFVYFYLPVLVGFYFSYKAFRSLKKKKAE